MSIASDIARIRKEFSGRQKLRILTLDIETRPHMAYVWKLWKENIPLERFIEAGYPISFASKWYDQPNVDFISDFHTGHDEMIYQAWDLLNEADIVVHFNGDRFDIPRINTEFARLGLAPPSPYKSIDLYKIVRSRFGLPSNKLAYCLEFFGVGAKVKNSGMDLWIRCMANDPDAWEEMRIYNVGDVTGTEDLYTYIRPWIKNHPIVSPLEDGEADVCIRCGSENLTITDKVERTPSFEYGTVVCLDCGGWMKERSGNRISNLRSI